MSIRYCYNKLSFASFASPCYGFRLFTISLLASLLIPCRISCISFQRLDALKYILYVLTLYHVLLYVLCHNKTCYNLTPCNPRFHMSFSFMLLIVSSLFKNSVRFSHILSNSSPKNSRSPPLVSR